MSMALKYAMQKRAKKMASGGECQPCKEGVCMAHGGEIGVHPVASGDAGYEGRSVAGRSVGNKTRHGNADAKKEHHKILAEMKSMKKPHLEAEGGFISDEMADGYDEDEDMINRIMKKRYSKGGRVANDTEPVADFAENEFDDLPLEDDMEFHDTGANSGDELGDEQEDADRHDIVNRIMKSRRKKDHNPRPA